MVQASILSSSLWENFKLRNLSHPHRDGGHADYSQFIDRIGDGEVESTYSVDGDTQLMKLEPMAVTTSKEDAIQFVFPDMNDTFLCSERAIITGRNAVVDDLNSKILIRMNGQQVMLHSVTRLAPEDHTHLSHFLTEEFLHSLTSHGVPNHQLKLNCRCLVMHNISVQDRVMNTKVIVGEVGRKFVTVETLPERRQFPLRPCYAITVNKSHGQTLKKVCFDVREHPFTHGQLYVGTSRVRNGRDILMLMRLSHVHDSDEERGLPRTATIVDRLGSGSIQTDEFSSPVT